MKPLQRKMRNTSKSVTILVLVDSVLQYNSEQAIKQSKSSHNPCFSGQCFAMSLIQESPLVRLLFVTILVLVDSVLQYGIEFISHVWDLSHNPCFSGQCFAILHEF